MKKSTKYLTIYAITSTIVSIIFISNTISLLESNTTIINPNQTNQTQTTNQTTKTQNELVESYIRNLSTDQLNSLMIITAETLTENYRKETLTQFELEHERHANRLAIGHMNKVITVLTKSMSQHPTSTLSNSN